MTSKNHNKKLNCIYGAIIFSVLCLLFLSYQYNDIDLHLNTERAVPFATAWIYGDSSTRQELELPAELAIPAGDDYTITNTLPTDLVEGSSICIRTSSQSVRVFIDHKLLYENGTDKSLSFGKVIGSNWNIVRIPRGNAGKKIELVFNSPYQSLSGVINPIVYGSKSSLLFYILQQQIWGFIIFILIFSIGMGLLFAYLIMKIKMKIQNNQSILYLSLFSILFSVWLLSESKMLQFFTGNQIIVSLPAFFSLLLFPLPLLLYIDTVYQSHHRRSMSVLFWIYLANFILNVTLQLLQIKDFFETLQIANILVIVGILAIFADCCIESFEYKNRDALHFLKSLCIFFLFASLELLSFYRRDYLSVTKYLRVGFLIFIVLLTFDSISKVQKMIASKKEAEYFEKLAYSDLLTKGKNRTAYMKDMNFLIENGSINQLCFLLFDVNNLKQINDTYGHIQGDAAIRNAYNCICEIFDRLGTCYRMGGDEFACIIKNTDKLDFDSLLADFNKKVAAINQTTKYVFEIAVGYDLLTTKLDMDSLEKLYINADHKMYLNKKAMKSIG